jgi:hypothetical protein
MKGILAAFQRRTSYSTQASSHNRGPERNSEILIVFATFSIRLKYKDSQ